MTWKFQPIAKSSLRVGWILASSAAKARSGITPAYYSPADDYPVLHVEAITHREKAIFPATLVGRPPQEDAYLGLATERIFLPMLRMVLPEIVDMHLPPGGAFHNLAIVSIRKAYPGHAQKVMNAIWGLGQMMLTKCVVVVDDDIDPHDLSEVLFRITGNVDPKKDLLFSEGPLDELDHASDRHAYGSKVGIDATRKNRPFDNRAREWPADLAFPSSILQQVSERWLNMGSDLLSLDRSNLDIQSWRSGGGRFRGHQALCPRRSNHN